MTIHLSQLPMSAFRFTAFLSFLLFSFSISMHSFAAIEAVQFSDDKLEQRYQDLIAELRCLVCQNQNLADSDASLAKDLRKKTEEMLKAGNSDQEIMNYMRDRYGDFVLYRPPFSWSNALLWIGPFILLILAGTILLLNIRKRQQNEALRSSQNRDDTKHIKIRNLLNESPSLQDPGSVTRSDDKTKN